MGAPSPIGKGKAPILNGFSKLLRGLFERAHAGPLLGQGKPYANFRLGQRF